MVKRILIVDSEEKNFELLAGHITAAAPAVVIDYITDGNHALSLLDSGLHYCLLITDLKLVSADGLEVVQRGLASREQLPVFIGTDFTILDDLKTLLADYPNVRLYQRPAESFQVLDDVLTVLRSVPDDVVKTIAFPTLVEMIRIDRKSCLLEFIAGSESGYLCFDQGELFHAAIADKVGEVAFEDMLSRASTELRLFEGKYIAERNVHSNLSVLLLRCSTGADERKAIATAS